MPVEVRGMFADARLTDSAGQLVLSVPYFVEGLTGHSAQVLLDAQRAAGVPQVGQPLPGDSSLSVDEVVVTPLGAGACRVMVIYRGSSAVQAGGPGLGRDAPLIGGLSAPQPWRFGGQLVSIRTTRDVHGRLLKVYRKPGDEASALVATATRRVVLRTANRSRVVADPLPYWHLLGRVNAATFLSDPPRHWLCTQATASPVDRTGRWYRVELGFLRAAESQPTTARSVGWDGDLEWEDAATGRPDDAFSQEVNGVGRLVAPLYLPADFSIA